MPAIYTFDQNVVPDRNAAYYTNKPVSGVSAFHQHAPKPLPGLYDAKTPNDILSKIPMPKSQDHGWGLHTAVYAAKTLRCTPFNNKLKGDPRTQFKVPTGKPAARQSDDVEAQPRTEFAARVKRIIDYLNTLYRTQPATFHSHLKVILGTLNKLYANLNDRLPTSREISNIEEVETLMAHYLPLPVPPPASAPPVSPPQTGLTPNPLGFPSASISESRLVDFANETASVLSYGGESPIYDEEKKHDTDEMLTPNNADAYEDADELDKYHERFSLKVLKDLMRVYQKETGETGNLNKNKSDMMRILMGENSPVTKVLHQMETMTSDQQKKYIEGMAGLKLKFAE